MSAMSGSSDEHPPPNLHVTHKQIIKTKNNKQNQTKPKKQQQQKQQQHISNNNNKMGGGGGGMNIYINCILACIQDILEDLNII